MKKKVVCTTFTVSSENFLAPVYVIFPYMESKQNHFNKVSQVFTPQCRLRHVSLKLGSHSASVWCYLVYTNSNTVIYSWREVCCPFYTHLQILWVWSKWNIWNISCEIIKRFLLRNSLRSSRNVSTLIISCLQSNTCGNHSIDKKKCYQFIHRINYKRLDRELIK